MLLFMFRPLYVKSWASLKLTIYYKAVQRNYGQKQKNTQELKKTNSFIISQTLTRDMQSKSRILFHIKNQCH